MVHNKKGFAFGNSISAQIVSNLEISNSCLRIHFTVSLMSGTVNWEFYRSLLMYNIIPPPVLSMVSVLSFLMNSQPSIASWLSETCGPKNVSQTPSRSGEELFAMMIRSSNMSDIHIAKMQSFWPERQVQMITISYLRRQASSFNGMRVRTFVYTRARSVRNRRITSMFRFFWSDTIIIALKWVGIRIYRQTSLKSVCVSCAHWFPIDRIDLAFQCSFHYNSTHTCPDYL